MTTPRAGRLAELAPRIAIAALVAACIGPAPSGVRSLGPSPTTPPSARPADTPTATSTPTLEALTLDGRLYFARFDVELGDMTVWVADADGGAARKLVEGAHSLSCVQESTVVMAGPNSEGHLVMSAAALDGSPYGEVDVPAADLNLGVGACSKRHGVVFAEGWVLGDARRTGVYRVNFTASAARQLTNPEAGLHDIPGCVTADGERIAFIRADVGDNPGTLWTVRTDGTGEREVSDQPYKTGPACSPDGATFLVEVDGRLYLVDENNGAATEITSKAPEYAAHKYGPWFATDEIIMFSLQSPGPFHDIYAMRLDGSGLTRITNDSEVDNESPRLVPTS